MTVEGAADDSRAARLRGPLLTAGLAGAGAVALVLHDPHRAGSWGVCPFYAMTGLYCPLCGSLRGTSDLLHCDVVGAFAMNPLWVLLTPVVGGTWLSWLVRRWRDRPARQLPGRFWWGCLVLFLLFGVLRNLPGLAFLAPH